MTYAAAAAGFRRGRFTLASLAGAAIWVGAYLALGHVCGTNLQAAADLAGSALGLVAALAAVIGPGWWLLQAARSKNGD
ncbi:hypothetical protein ACEYYB_11630 [Paracoccus sp. p4-l81]|uniref:hypothetical protein n=1 Tax=Paracoccus sp. p4-l81 TaxID=3342806 RepID=UPI0035B9C00F